MVIYLTANEINDAAEGQIDVQDIAATLKDWTRPFPTADDWMDTPPEVSAGCRERAEGHTTDIEQNIEAQIAELDKNLETEVAKWAHQANTQKALRLDKQLRLAFSGLQESLDNIAEDRRSLEAAGYPLSDGLREELRRTRQELLDMDLELEIGPEWAEWVNAQPAFAGLDGDKERKSRGAQHHKSRAAQQRKARAAQRRKHRRR